MSNRKPIWKKPLSDCKNWQKDKKKIQLLQRKLANIRDTYRHEVSRQIVNDYPKGIVLEDLNVQGMMKNKHLSKAIQQQGFYDLRQKITYKAEALGIPVKFADAWYPSSKTCSYCGKKKNNLKLSDRVFHCGYCGKEIDRDLNASMNLANLFDVI
jgi:putative transposase